jgi:nucleoid-associated protein EbfC
MNLQEMMRQAQRMQKRLQKVQEEAGERTVEGSAGGGMVVVTLNGRNELLSVKLDPQVVSVEEIDMLQDLVVAAVNQAISRATEMMKEEMAKVTGGVGGMPIPGMF